MRELGPEFIDVTWGAGGSTSETTLDICTNVAKFIGLETCMHLTCTNMPREEIDNALKVCKAAGIQNILALRGDPPKGQERWTAVEGGFEHAIDLVNYIRREYGDYFGIGVAGYPEKHVDCPSMEEDIAHLKAKVDAGADFVVTQVFYDADHFIAWVARCREVGISCPIIPGLMPINTYAGWKRIVTLCKTLIPAGMEEELEAIKDDDQAVKDYGITFLMNMIKKLLAAGFEGLGPVSFFSFLLWSFSSFFPIPFPPDFHFYTLNLEKATIQILEGLGFVPPQESIKPLPWKKSAGKRENETVRPIFWVNKTKSYVARTESWDDFPNGRWGDSRSPAFGEFLDAWGTLKLPADQARHWGTPTSLDDIAATFVKYLNGEITSLPWSDVPLALESGPLKSFLTGLNTKHLFTVNSQPAVNGEQSTHPVHGWGGSGGFVYQKAYLEFFISPEAFDRLLPFLAKNKAITYYATSSKSTVTTNCKSAGRPTALTWGVFPGSEIVQPTIIDIESFAVWKEEAFSLWSLW